MAEKKLINRELSWIEFNARVLHEACRKELPLMERLRFLGIVTSNFHEFFQVRVASLKRAEKLTPHATDANGQTAAALLREIAARCHQITHLQYETLMDDVLPALAREGIAYVNARDYSSAQKSYTESLFRHEIFPVLTPLRTDGPEIPQIGNMRLHAAFLLEPIEGLHAEQSVFSAKKSTDIVAIVPIPESIPRIVWLPGSEQARQFTVLDDIIAQYGTELFPGYNVKETLLFQIARDADFSVDEDAGNNFIQAMEEVLVKRQSSFAVRMVCNATSQKLRSIIQEKLSLADDDVYQVNGLIDPSTLMDLASLDEAGRFLYPDWEAFYPAGLQEGETLWNTLRQHDILLNVPYESYEPVVSFIRDAAHDENVLAIKMTLYRTGSNSPIVQALKEAAQSGKTVTAFVELKARFDEKRNISWASELEKAGVIVIYGVVNLKVHAKICLVVRRESDGIRRYVHLSTGNYNPKTARLYQDFSIFTANQDIAGDATLFFNVISGYSALQPMHHLYMAPVTLKTRLLDMIEREIRQSSPEHPGLIIAKMNSLCHAEIREALYRASCAGVRVRLNIRGICTLVPGVPGQSENISVVSIIDRYLEHSRIIYFQNGGAEELYLSSADWMDRNLDRRIELMFPVTDPAVFKTVKETLLLYFQDNTHSHELQADGTWKAKSPEEGNAALRVQEVLYKKYKKLDEMKKSAPKQEFVIRRKN
ncbi:MAG TPA: polyphosphate kinase 1 [Treponema sp.]|nr:polyphosphate kinase 1 [Treponema sp.]